MKMKCSKKQLVVLFLILSVCVSVMELHAFAATTDRTIKIGTFPLNGFWEIASDGTVTGYGAEYTEAVFEHGGWDYEYVFFDSWVDALDALSKNEIDILAPAQHTPERDEIYTFDSFPIGTEYGSLLALSTNDNLIYEDFDAFNGLHVGAVASLVFLDDFEVYEARNNFQVNLSYYKDTPALMAALNAGEVDAALVNMMVKTDANKLLARFGASPFYYMISPNARDFGDELNSVIDKLSSNHPELQGELSNEHFSGFDQTPYSKEELDFIAQSGTLNVACNDNYPPFTYTDKETGEITGVDRAVLEKISELSGLKFSYVPMAADSDGQTFQQENQITFAAGVEKDQYTSLHSNQYSNTYLTIPKYFVSKKETVFDVEASVKVAYLNSGEEQAAIWQETYPNFEFVRYDSLDACVEAVHAGKVDFILSNRYSMERVLAAPKNQDLQLLPDASITSNLCFEIYADGDNAEILTSILNKSIRDISATEMDHFVSDYTQENQYSYTLFDFLYQYRYELIIGGVIALGGMVVLVMVLKTKRKARQMVRENERKLRHITNNINGGVVVLKAHDGLNITYANEGFLELVGCTRQEFENGHDGSYFAYVHPDDLDKIQEILDTDREEMSFELRVRKMDGNYVPVLFNCTATNNINGYKELYCVILDMTEQYKLMEQLRIEKRRTDLILDRVDEVFYEISLADHSISASNSFFEKLGWTLPERVPSSKEEYGQMWHTNADNLEKMRVSTEEMKEKKEPVSVIVQIESKVADRMVWCEIFQHPILAEDSSIVTIIGLIRDVDEQVSEREKLIEQAQRDPLTGLYNKEAFEDIVTEALLKMPEQNHAFIFIDLDHFKSVNDTLGHMVGDRAICEAADKLRVIFSNYDVLSRFGGDEFCVFVKNIPTDTLKGKMDWLVEKLHADYKGEKGSVQITCSCGICSTEVKGHNYQTLMKCADEALYESKENGRNRYTFYGGIEN